MIDTGVLPDPNLAVVKGDPFPRGQYGEYWACFETTVPFEYRASWYSLYYDRIPEYYVKEIEKLEQIDENHGVYTLLVYGSINPSYTATRCEEVSYRYQGSSLMVRKDGSIQRLQMYPDIYKEGAAVTTYLCHEKLFTGINGICRNQSK